MVFPHAFRMYTIFGGGLLHKEYIIHSVSNRITLLFTSMGIFWGIIPHAVSDANINQVLSIDDSCVRPARWNGQFRKARQGVFGQVIEQLSQLHVAHAIRLCSKLPKYYQFRHR